MHRIGMGCPAAMMTNLFVHSTYVNSGDTEMIIVDAHCRDDFSAEL